MTVSERWKRYQIECLAHIFHQFGHELHNFNWQVTEFGNRYTEADCSLCCAKVSIISTHGSAWELTLDYAVICAFPTLFQTSNHVFDLKQCKPEFKRWVLCGRYRNLL